jgi:hypothetical protein
MLRAMVRALARVWRPRRRSDGRGFQDQQEARRFQDQQEAAEGEWEQYGPGGSGF